MTEELKLAVESAKTDEEKKAVAKKFREELRGISENELGAVAGGTDLCQYLKDDMPDDSLKTN